MKAVLALGALSLGAVTQTPILAQTPPEASDATSSDAGEIIVTATKRAENLQNVPISITSVSSANISNAKVEGIDDLAILLTGVDIGYNGAGVTTFIRGVGSSDVTPGQEAAVATYVDGVYYSLPYGAHLAFNNVERVEVLKGPQGTLFGRNATGGLINVITREPSGDTSFDGQFSYGNYNTATAKAYGTTGFGSKIAADLAVYYTRQGDGFGKNVFTGSDAKRTREIAVRSKWVFRPSDATKITLIGDYDKLHSTIGFTYNIVPGSGSILGPVNPPTGFYDVALNLDPFNTVKAYGASARIDQDLGFASLVSISAYRRVINRFRFDNDATIVPLVNVEANKTTGRTYSQEIQLISDSTSSDRFKWIAGAFYLHDYSGFGNPDGLVLSGLGIDIDGAGPALPPDRESIVGVITTKSYSGFGEGSVRAGRAQLTLGARYTHDSRDFYSRIDAFDASGAFAYTVAPPNQRASYNKVTFRALLDYHLTDDVLTYASFSRGFKSGNFNTVNFANPSFKPEVLDAYELGLKSQFLDRRLTVNAAGFYYDYTNLQLVSQQGNTQITQNAGTARVYGLEASGSFRLTRHFDVSAGISYLDGKYTKFDGAIFFYPLPGGGFSQVTQSAAGKRLIRTPRYSWNASANYVLPTSMGDYSVNVSYAHTGQRFMEADNFHAEPAYDLVNARLGWKPNKTFGIGVYVRNLLKEKYSIYTVTSPITRFYNSGAPRTYGAELQVKF